MPVCNGVIRPSAKGLRLLHASPCIHSRPISSGTHGILSGSAVLRPRLACSMWLQPFSGSWLYLAMIHLACTDMPFAHIQGIATSLTLSCMLRQEHIWQPYMQHIWGGLQLVHYLQQCSASYSVQQQCSHPAFPLQQQQQQQQ